MDNIIRNSLFNFAFMHRETTKTQYCQSCGMPLRFDVQEYLGTNSDQSRSDEYCYYCLDNGEYTVDIPMEQMVDIWVKYTDKYNDYSFTNYNPEDLRAILQKRLPTLKRWKQKQITGDLHYEAIEKIKNHIDRNLEQTIQMEELCRIANLSFFHLRRVFKGVTGENIGSYIQRLRLESVAHKLISTRFSINEILNKTGYQTNASLAKAFRKHFGLSMSDYRKKNAHSLISVNEGHRQIITSYQPEIKKLNSQKAICYTVHTSNNNIEEYMESWKKMLHYKDKYMNSKSVVRFISISQDDPKITPLNQCRFYIGVLITDEYKPKGKFSLREIPGGIYAVFRHTGSYSGLPELYQFIYEEWLPQSPYSQSNSVSFEIYLNTPRNTNINELMTEVYIPIEKH